MALAHGRIADAVSRGPARCLQCLELGFHVGCPVLPPVLTAGPKCEHKTKAGTCPASALGYGSSHSCALRRGSAPAELLLDLAAGSRKGEWCGAARACSDSH